MRRGNNICFRLQPGLVASKYEHNFHLGSSSGKQSGLVLKVMSSNLAVFFFFD